MYLPYIYIYKVSIVAFTINVGVDVDKTKSSTIKRGFNDNTTLLVVFYGTLLILIVLFDSFSNGIMKNNFVITGTFIMTLEIEYLLFEILKKKLNNY